MTQPEPHESTPDELRRAARWAVPQILILGAALATAPHSSPGLPAASPPGPRADADRPTPETLIPEELGAPPPVTNPPPEGPINPDDRVSRLLYQHVFERRAPPSEKQRYSDLISLLRTAPRPAVTLINLWGAGCEPCKREFAGFRDILSERDKVRFIAIQLGKDEPGELLAALPPPSFDLYDIGTGDGKVREVLASLNLVEKNATIPITMVLDCQNHLRWIQTHEVKDMGGFRKFIDERIAEIPELCPQATAPQTEALTAPPPATRCGDGTCNGSENSETCCKDCGCPLKHRCGPQGNACLPEDLMD